MSHEIDCLLQIETLRLHSDDDHVVGITFDLLDIIRENVLDKGQYC